MPDLVRMYLNKIGSSSSSSSSSSSWAEGNEILIKRIVKKIVKHGRDLLMVWDV